MRILCFFLVAAALTGCGMSAYNPNFIVSDAPQLTVENPEASSSSGSKQEPVP